MNAEERRQMIERLQREEAADVNQGDAKLSPAERWAKDIKSRQLQFLKAANPRRGDDKPNDQEQELLRFWEMQGMHDYAMRGGARPFPAAEVAHLWNEINEETETAPAKEPPKD